MPDAVTVDVPSLDAIGDVIAVGTPKRIFVSSHAYSGDLGGLTGADQKCQDLAGGAGLGGTYKAWLSSTQSSAAQRLTHASGNYVLVNGTKVAVGWTGLTSGALLVPINVTESGGPPPTVSSGCAASNSSPVWTGTAPNGSLGTTTGATCADWTTSGPSNGGVLGLADHADGSWTDGCSSQSVGSTICSMNAALYCVEQ